MFGHVIAVPQLLTAGPHSLPAHAAASSGMHPHALAPAPAIPQPYGATQVFGHVIAVPQLLTDGPHAFPAQAATLSGVHPHPLGPAPPPPHTLGGPHVLGQATILPQLSMAGPHALVAHVTVTGSETHVHTAGVPRHASPVAHAVHRALSAQPFVASSGTQALPHFFVAGGHVPMTQLEPLQTSVPAPGSGHPARVQPSPQP